MIVHHLEWDSNFFGLKIGKVEVNNEANFDINAFQKATVDYDLVYVIKNETIFSNSVINALSLDLMDSIISMSINIDANPSLINQPFRLFTKLSPHETKECHEIAEEVSVVSRFYKEPLIGPEKTKKLYRTWVDNAINGSFSDGLFIKKSDEAIRGIHAVKKVGDFGYFTLTGIHSKAQGKGHGAAIWNESLAYFAQQYRISKVFSRLSLMNVPSFNFHLKFGFSKIEGIQFVYHFRPKN